MTNLTVGLLAVLVLTLLFIPVQAQQCPHGSERIYHPAAGGVRFACECLPGWVYSDNDCVPAPTAEALCVQASSIDFESCVADCRDLTEADLLTCGFELSVASCAGLILSTGTDLRHAAMACSSDALTMAPCGRDIEAKTLACRQACLNDDAARREACPAP